MMPDIAIGDVWAVRNTGFVAALIRFGAHLRGKNSLDNHVLIVHHQDANGTWWGVEGRPGGVGWVDIDHYQNSVGLTTNFAQPKTFQQRADIAKTAEGMLGTAYDWQGIYADAATDLNLPKLFAQDWHGQGTPGHVVCSSLAAWIYQHVGLPAPEGRWVQPADWTDWDLHQAWSHG